MSCNTVLRNIQDNIFSTVSIIDNTIKFSNSKEKIYLENSCDGIIVCSDDLVTLCYEKIIKANLFEYKSIDNFQVIDYKIYTFVTEFDVVTILYIDKFLKL